MTNQPLSEQVRELEERLQSKGREVTQLRSELIAADALRRAAESRLAQARVEGAREALTRIAEMGQDGKWERTVKPDSPFRPHWMEIAGFRDREYPAVPEGGERKCEHCGHAASLHNEKGACWHFTGMRVCQCRPTPTPERVSDMYLHVQTIGVQTLTEDGYKRIEQTVVRVTPQDAKALVSLAAQDGGNV